jgi:hypothetical protein
MSAGGIKLGMLAKRSGVSRRTLLSWCQPDVTGHVRLRNVRRGLCYFVNLRDAEHLIQWGTPPASLTGKTPPAPASNNFAR